MDRGRDAQTRQLDRAAVRCRAGGAGRGVACDFASSNRGDRAPGLRTPDPRTEAPRASRGDHRRTRLRAPAGPRHRGLADRAHGTRLLGNRVLVRPGGIPERDGPRPRPCPRPRLRHPRPQRPHVPDHRAPVLPRGFVRHRGAFVPAPGEARRAEQHPELGNPLQRDGAPPTRSRGSALRTGPLRPPGRGPRQRRAVLPQRGVQPPRGAGFELHQPSLRRVIAAPPQCPASHAAACRGPGPARRARRGPRASPEHGVRARGHPAPPQPHDLPRPHRVRGLAGT